MGSVRTHTSLVLGLFERDHVTGAKGQQQNGKNKPERQPSDELSPATPTKIGHFTVDLIWQLIWRNN